LDIEIKKNRPKPPTLYTVFNCLLSDSYGIDSNFEDWCGETGFNSDSRKAFKTYELAQEQTKNLKNFMGKELFNQFLKCEDME